MESSTCERKVNILPGIRDGKCEQTDVAGRVIGRQNEGWVLRFVCARAGQGKAGQNRTNVDCEEKISFTVQSEIRRYNAGSVMMKKVGR